MSGSVPVSAIGNSAFNFNGSAYVEVPDAPALRLSNNFTIEAWVYLQDGSNETIMDKGPTYSYLFMIYPNGQPGLGLYANFGGAHNWVYSSAVTVPINQWSHVAVTFTNAVNGLKFWVNGNLVSQHTPAGALTSYTGAMNIGRQEPGGCNCNLLQSRLDEVRIWNSARSQAEIQSTMTKEIPGSTSGLVAYWDFNNGSGTSVTNRTSTTGIDGTFINYPGNSNWVSGVPRADSASTENGLGTHLNNFVYGPDAQSASSTWQYFETANDLSTATLLSNWQASGNEIISHQNQWDNNRVNGNYPFVQYVHSPPASTFNGNSAMLIHPDDAGRRASVGWKNTTGSTRSIDIAATLKLAYPGNNSDGITYSLHRGLLNTPRYLSVQSGTIAAGSTTALTIDKSIELQSGELAYLSVGNNGQYFWDHTIATMSVSYTALPPANSVAPVISGTTRNGETLTTTNGTWSASPTSYSYQWKRASSVAGSYTDIPSATSNTYVLTDADVGKYIKVSVTATNSIGSSVAELSVATSVVSDLPDSVVPTVTASVATATGFTFTISNFSNSYTYALTTTKGTVSRSTDDVTVTGLTAGESATVTISVTRSTYKPASKTVTGSATPASTTTTTAVPVATTAAPALSIVIQAPVTTVAQGQASVETIAPLSTVARSGASVTTTTTTTTVAARVSSVTTTTSTVARSVPTTTVGPPDIAKVSAGESSVLLDGVKTDTKVARQNNAMVVTAGSVSATLSGINDQGKTVPLDSDGSVRLSAGDSIKVAVGGFKPDSEVEVWLFSTPVRLGSAPVGSDGSMSKTFILPAGVKSGNHRVAVLAKLPNGKTATFTLGIVVGEISTTSTVTRVLIAIPIALAIGFGLILPTRLRRRRTVETSPS